MGEREEVANQDCTNPKYEVHKQSSIRRDRKTTTDVKRHENYDRCLLCHLQGTQKCSDTVIMRINQ